MGSFDFHGYTKEESFKKMDQIIYSVRKDKTEEIWYLITGKGPIQESLMKYCLKQNLDCKISWGNSGVLEVFIE